MNRQAVEIVKRYEGCRLTAYRDAVDIWTIGWGHTGPDVKPGMEWTQDQADEALIHDMETAQAAVGKGVRGSLRECEEAALVSLAYNIGSGAFAGSTVLRKVNEGDYIAAALAFTLFHKAGGKPLKGLLRRRLDEAALFLKP